MLINSLFRLTALPSQAGRRHAPPTPPYSAKFKTVEISGQLLRVGIRRGRGFSPPLVLFNGIGASRAFGKTHPAHWQYLSDITLGEYPTFHCDAEILETTPRSSCRPPSGHQDARSDRPSRSKQRILHRWISTAATFSSGCKTFGVPEWEDHQAALENPCESNLARS